MLIRAYLFSGEFRVRRPGSGKGSRVRRVFPSAGHTVLTSGPVQGAGDVSRALDVLREVLADCRPGVAAWRSADTHDEVTPVITIGGGSMSSCGWRRHGLLRMRIGSSRSLRVMCLANWWSMVNRLL